ncbi:DUF1801 domain-containing protein [Aequorivita sp. H23M31]|uniref:DUF1801 domain-containing protein n=1 Tax=Aequorivita ciconiae TaxID=2494375 RepID=A0A410G529_9FLAO|nr:DUF1801 domain-containing protein [Aequorivita sp. H23M31]QAA82394.1 DUF1801 domain-containing protein [Aequorivita sp. H23M31]
MKGDQEFEEAIQSFSEEIKNMSRQTRNLIRKIFPEVVEVVWKKQKNIGFGTGPKKKTEHFCWLMPATKHVTLGFNYGAQLPDPSNILEGTGKLFRHYKVKNEVDLSNQDLINLIKFAIDFRGKKI